MSLLRLPIQYVTVEQQANVRQGKSTVPDPFAIAAIVEKLPNMSDGLLVLGTLFDDPDAQILIKYDPTQHRGSAITALKTE